MPRIFILASKVLQLTRRNVARTTSYGFSEWKPQKYLLILGGMSSDGEGGGAVWESAYHPRAAAGSSVETLDYVVGADAGSVFCREPKVGQHLLNTDLDFLGVSCRPTSLSFTTNFTPSRPRPRRHWKELA